MFVIFASGLKYVGVPTGALGWTLGAILLVAAAAWVGFSLRRRGRPGAAIDPAGQEADHAPEPLIARLPWIIYRR